MLSRLFYTSYECQATQSPQTLPLFPSRVDSVKSGPGKGGDRTEWLFVTEAEKQNATSAQERDDAEGGLPGEGPTFPPT